MLPRRILFFIGFSLLLSGCSNKLLIKTLTTSNCPPHDGYRLGYAEGLQGKSLQQLKTIYPDCDSDFILEQQIAYESGWRAGIQQYCAPENVLRLGKRGQPYPTHCPRDTQKRVTAAWQKGLETYCEPSLFYSQGQQGKAFPALCENPRLKTKENLSAYQQGKKDFTQLVLLQSQLRDIEKNMELQQNRAKSTSRQLNSAKRRYMNQPFNPETQCYLRMLQIRLNHLTDQIHSLTEDSKEIHRQYEAIKAKTHAFIESK